MSEQLNRAAQVGSIAVVGAGQMGAGIAQVFAMAGYETKLQDLSKEASDKALGFIDKMLGKAVEKEKIPAALKDETLRRLRVVPNLESIKDADLIVEAIVENEEIKFDLFSKLDELCKPDTVLATNTSSISITKIAAATNRPEKVVGMHFMNPVPIMQLVELICGLQTSDETYELARELTLKLGKTPVTAKHDYPGFIVNRILIPMINEACYALMEGLATPEDIDTAMKLGTNQPMGPLTLADFVGLDTVLSIAQIFQRELGDDKYRPCPLLVKYVEAGWVGRKAGRGFYRYDQ